MHRITSGGPADFEAASVFWAEFFDKHDRSPEYLVKRYLGAAGILFAIARAGDELVGLTLGMPARTGSASEGVPELFPIKTLFTHPAHRRTGIGRGVLEHLVADARNAGYTRFQLWVHTGNQAACSLYESLGFRADGAPAHDNEGTSITRFIRRAEQQKRAAPAEPPFFLNPPNHP